MARRPGIVLKCAAGEVGLETRAATKTGGLLMILRASLTIAFAAMSAAMAAQRLPAEPEAPPAASLEWCKLPEGRTQIGSMHGDIAVSSAGEIYISVEGGVTQRFAILGPNPGLQVYAADGRFLRNVERAPSDLHGFVIHRDAGGEFIYGVRLAGGPSEADQTRGRLSEQVIVKMALDGTVVLAVPASRIPDGFKNKANDGRPFMRLTGIAVAPNGDIYATDGYASDYVHRFDSKGNYIASFGGKQAPYGFRTLHKLAVDTRFTPPRLIATDRENGRLVHLSLDGEFLGVVASDLQLPAAVVIDGDNAIIGELRGRVTILDKAGKVVTHVGTNTGEGIGTNQVKPDQWKTGLVLSPHGVAINDRGDLFVSAYLR